MPFKDLNYSFVFSHKYAIVAKEFNAHSLLICHNYTSVANNASHSSSLCHYGLYRNIVECLPTVTQASPSL